LISEYCTSIRHSLDEEEEQKRGGEGRKKRRRRCWKKRKLSEFEFIKQP
jgi:hypothetical protein